MPASALLTGLSPFPGTPPDQDAERAPSFLLPSDSALERVGGITMAPDRPGVESRATAP